MGSIESDSVLSFFSQQCCQHPDNTAIDDGPNGKLSYSQLDQQSSTLARCLQQNGITAGQVIPLLTTSRLEMVIAVLGILKASGVYVPVDVDQWPADRINYVLSRTCSGLVVYTGDHIPSGVDLEEECRAVQVQIRPESALEAQYEPNRRPQLMCIIFTSGTTDKPKGVMIPHSSVARFVTSPGFNYDIVPGDRLLLVLSVAFDGMFNPLFSLNCRN